MQPRNETFVRKLRTIVADVLLLLTFRSPSSAIQTYWRSYLTFGLLFTWFAGIGRYWDNPRATLLQYLGLGSVVYVFALALIIWLLIAPLRPRNWSYRNVLLFVTLTSPPALLYAIPVERFMSLQAASTVNVWFLAIVAVWRVALYSRFLRTVGGLSGGSVAIATLMPLAIIVLSLMALNLEHVVFRIMGGLRDYERSGNDGAYGVVTTLSMFSVLASPVLLILYLIQVVRAWRNKMAARQSPAATKVENSRSAQ